MNSALMFSENLKTEKTLSFDPKTNLSMPLYCGGASFFRTLHTMSLNALFISVSIKKLQLEFDWILIQDFDQLSKVEAEIKGMFSKMRIQTPKVNKMDKLRPALTVEIPARLLNRVSMGHQRRMTRWYNPVVK